MKYHIYLPPNHLPHTNTTQHAEDARHPTKMFRQVLCRQAKQAASLFTPLNRIAVQQAAFSAAQGEQELSSHFSFP
jgi:hypothetical protein